MIWENEKPAPISINLKQREDEIQESAAILDDKKQLTFSGPRGSGKTFALKNYLKRKSPQEQALILIAWSTERKGWKEFIEKEGVENTVFHTPDSLALYLINSWSRRENKRLEWIYEPQDQLPAKPWMDSESYAKTMLAKSKISIGVAHWLLQNEIESFIRSSMIPKADLLCLDEPEAWEEEAYSWINHIPHTRKIISKHSQFTLKNDYSKNSKSCINLEGWISSSGKLYNKRWVEICGEEPKNWNEFTIISQHIDKLEKKLCKRRGAPIRTVEQTRGRRYKKVWLDNLPTNSKEKKYWGDRLATQDKLDLVCSVSLSECYSMVNDWDIASVLPKKPKDCNFLTWEV